MIASDLPFMLLFFLVITWHYLKAQRGDLVTRCLLSLGHIVINFGHFSSPLHTIPIHRRLFSVQWKQITSKENFGLPVCSKTGEDVLRINILAQSVACKLSVSLPTCA